MSKTFIKTALTTPPEGLAEVIQWLYLPSHKGPQLLRLVVEECRTLLPGAAPTEGMEIQSGEASGILKNEGKGCRSRLSSGALVLLKRNLEWLEEYLRNKEGLMMQDPMDVTGVQ